MIEEWIKILTSIIPFAVSLRKIDGREEHVLSKNQPWRFVIIGIGSKRVPNLKRQRFKLQHGILQGGSLARSSLLSLKLGRPWLAPFDSQILRQFPGLALQPRSSLFDPRVLRVCLLAPRESSSFFFKKELGLVPLTLFAQIKNLTQAIAKGINVPGCGIKQTRCRFFHVMNFSKEQNDRATYTSYLIFLLFSRDDR